MMLALRSKRATRWSTSMLRVAASTATKFVSPASRTDDVTLIVVKATAAQSSRAGPESLL